MPSIEKAERRDQKLEKRRTKMPQHGRESIDLIQREIMRRADKKRKQLERDWTEDG